MRQSQTLFFLIMFLGLSGCVSPPYMNLRQPIYMITDHSFFAGCEEDANGPAACKEWRILQVKRGVSDWFEHFDEPTRPQVIIVASNGDIPDDSENTPIHLQIQSGYCNDSDGAHPACYHYSYDSEPSIVFDSHVNIDPFLSAHEFGHALGRDNDDTPEKVGSVMSYSIPTYVLPIDIQMLCELHDECPSHEDTWCEGGFIDPCRCPSASFEEGEALHEAGEIVCE